MRRRRFGRGLSVSMGTLEKFCISFWANRVFRAVSYLQALFEHAYEITALKEKPAVKGHCFGGNAGKASFLSRLQEGVFSNAVPAVNWASGDSFARWSIKAFAPLSSVGSGAS